MGEVKDEERPDDGQRQRRGGHERGAPIPQKRQQDEHGQDAADHDRFADAADRLGDEPGKIVDLRDADGGRQRGPVVAQRPLDAVGNGEDVPANLSRDADIGRRLPVAADERRPIDDAFADLRDVADVHRRLLPERDNDPTDVVEAGQLAGRQHEVLLVVLRQPAHRRDLIRVLQGFRHLIERQLGGVQLVRINDHRELALVGRDDVDARDAGNAAEQRPNLEHRDVAQIRRGNVPGDVEAHHRKQRGRHPLDPHLGAGGQPRPHLVHLALHQLQRVRHVGVRVEDRGDFGRPTDRARPHAPDAKHLAASSSGRVTAISMIRGARSPECATMAMRGNSTSG